MKQTLKPVSSDPIGDADEVRGLLELLRDRIAQADAKTSVADYIRMLQLYRELEGERPKEIRVRWVEDSTSTG